MEFHFESRATILDGLSCNLADMFYGQISTTLSEQNFDLGPSFWNAYNLKSTLFVKIGKILKNIIWLLGIGPTYLHR